MPNYRKPAGIIDDIFEPLGKAAIHEVRQAVRTFVRHESNLKGKVAAGTKRFAQIAKKTGHEARITGNRTSRQFDRIESSRIKAREYFKSEASFKRAAAEERGAMGLNPKPRNVKGK